MSDWFLARILVARKGGVKIHVFLVFRAMPKLDHSSSSPLNPAAHLLGVVTIYGDTPLLLTSNASHQHINPQIRGVRWWSDTRIRNSLPYLGRLRSQLLRHELSGGTRQSVKVELSHAWLGKDPQCMPHSSGQQLQLHLDRHVLYR